MSIQSIMAEILIVILVAVLCRYFYVLGKTEAYSDIAEHIVSTYCETCKNKGETEDGNK